MAVQRQTSLGMASDFAGDELQLFPDLMDLQDSITGSDGADDNYVMTPSPSEVRLDFLGDDDDFVSYLTGKRDDATSVTSDGGMSDEAIDAPSMVCEENSRPSVKVGQAGKKTVVVPRYLFNNGANQRMKPSNVNGTTYVVLANPNRSCATGKSETVDKSFDYDDMKSMSKNAIAARENRQRKKNYINGLERTVKTLSAENVDLKTQLTSTKNSVKTLQNEVKYLRSVLANQSTLSALLQNINQTPKINITSSESTCNSTGAPNDDKPVGGITTRGRKRKLGLAEVPRKEAQKENINNKSSDTHESNKVQKLDHCYANAGLKFGVLPQEEEIDVESNSDAAPGVCLHVSGRNVSLEFCAECSHKATKVKKVIQ